MSANEPAATALATVCAIATFTSGTGCGVWPPTPPGPTEDCQAVRELLSGWGVRMPNPASLYCAQIGGEGHIEETEAGQIGICVLPDGTEHNQWDLYCGDCQDRGVCSPSMLD